MSSNGVLVTPVELNRSLLNSLFKFKPDSKLQPFIARKTNQDKTIYTLAEVLTHLKDIIRGEKLFDLQNPSIIICSNELEEAINMKALHVTEIRDLVLSQLTKVQDQTILGKFANSINNTQNRSNPTQAPPSSSVRPQRMIQSASVSTQISVDKKALFHLKPKFLEVVRSLPSVDPTQSVFSYEEVTLLLSTYILSHKEKFFDSRNIKLAIVAGDPLGEAFGVQAFHRCQVNNLLKSQLIPLQSNGSTDIKAEVRSTGSSGVNVSISEMSVPVTSKLGEARPPADLTGSAAGLVLPAFPSLNKALTAPAGSSSGIVRKRSDSESEPEARNKQARTEVRNLVIVRPGSRSDYSENKDENRGDENATIVYDNDFDGNADEEYDEDADDESDSNFQEFEVESGSDEEERPSQAMGGVHHNSTDSESEVDASFRYLNKKEVSRKTEECKKESVYWADCEKDKKDLDSYDSELEPADLWKCLKCGTPNKPYIRYCGKCWRERKGWVSSYQRKKKRKTTKEEKIVYRVDTETETDSAEREGDLTEDKSIPSSQDSLDIAGDRSRMNSQDSGISSMDSQELELSVKTDEPDSKINLNRSLSLDLKNASRVKSSLGSPASSMDSGFFSSNKEDNSLCLFCVTRKKNASLVHGRIGHQVCCYPCAKKLWRKKAECPVCRRTVERIIKLIQA